MDPGITINTGASDFGTAGFIKALKPAPETAGDGGHDTHFRPRAQFSLGQLKELNGRKADPLKQVTMNDP